MRKAEAELLQKSRQLAIEEATLMGTDGSARAFEKGEDPETADLPTVHHWLTIYSDLADFCRQLLTEMVPHDRVGDGARACQDVSRARLALELELNLYELHLRYWRRRHDQLRACDR